MKKSLSELESSLRERAARPPGSALRARLLDAVWRELSDSRAASTRRAGEMYWVAATAATVMMTLSMVCSSRDEFSEQPQHVANQFAAEIRMMQQIEANQQKQGFFR
jgi:hypothetical protein